MLSIELMNNIRELLGIRELNLVQRLAIPKILKGYNVLIISPTGTGKTEAALLPIFDLIMRRKERVGITALYVTPLRALNRDIFKRMEKLARSLGINIAIRHGDTPASVRRQQARSPPDMLITTPETLQAILPGKIFRYHLMHVKYVIIDEIHELVSDRRGAQLFLALERLRRISGYDFQRVGLSATIGDVNYVAECLRGSSKRLTEVINVQLARKYIIEVDIPSPIEEDEKIANEINLSPEIIARLRKMCEAIKDVRSALVFTNTRDTAEALAFRLKNYAPDIRILVHHGSLSREERIRAESELKKGKLKALVCTSSLELGIDIGSVDLVIQYSSPRQATTLLQRIGRSGHRIGGEARGLIIALHPEEALEAAVLAKMALRGELESIPKVMALDVLAHQVVGLLLDSYGELTIGEIYSTLKRAKPYNEITPETIINVINQLVREGIIRISEKGIISLRRGAWKYYYNNISTIPDTISYKVEDILSQRKVGELDVEFIAKYAREGLDFILGGRVWRIISIDHEKRVVLVEESENTEAAIPAWIGELIPVPFRCALEVASLRRRIISYIANGRRNPLVKYPLSERTVDLILSYMKEVYEKGITVPDDKNILIEKIGRRYAVIHIPLGSNGCYALGLLLSKILSEKLGASVGFRSDPYRVVLIAGIGISVKDVVSALEALKSEDYEEKLKEAVAESMIFKWKLFNVAKRFGLLKRDADFSIVSRRFIEMVRGTPIYEETINEILRDKVDLGAVRWLINRLRKGIIKIHSVELKNPSPISEPIMRLYFYDILVAKRPLSVIVDLLRKRILGSEVLLICLTCLRWSAVRLIETLPEKPACPNCGSRFLIALNPRNGKDALSIVSKLRVKKKLTKDETRALRRLQERAKVVLLYGKRGIITLTARGIGPKTAMKILREAKDENDLMMRILEAERQYFRTRRFWD